MSWHVYILRCADGTLYTGITTDPARRLDEHNRGTGARYTAPRRPVELFYVEEAEDRADASRRELEIKAMSREEKLRLVSTAIESA